MTSFDARLPRRYTCNQGDVKSAIAAKADFENLYDRPFDDKKKVRVAGPFTVESLIPYLDVSGNASD